ncbi:unnamed protein product [Phytophthora lilii]|uniref:Unnamed protein product n=1 Tax=Phytophthora lilii TaxID=2077276 RepID=A0A9W6Y145_9STRA|nr:unnamed protein product [Phytophthora lilii]
MHAAGANPSLPLYGAWYSSIPSRKDANTRSQRDSRSSVLPSHGGMKDLGFEDFRIAKSSSALRATTTTSAISSSSAKDTELPTVSCCVKLWSHVTARVALKNTPMPTPLTPIPTPLSSLSSSTITKTAFATFSRVSGRMK